MSVLDFSQLENYPTGILTLAFREASESESESIVEILTGRGESAFLPLVEALNDFNDSVRYYAVYTLKLIGDSRAAGPISNLLADNNDNVRILAALYLPTFGNIEIDRYKALLHSDDWRLRSSGAILLGQSPDDHAVELLLPLLKDENKRVSFDAMWALDKLVGSAGTLPGKEKIGPALTEAARDSDSDTRCMAAKILGNLGDGRAVEVLNTLKENDPEEYVREAAAKALEKLG